MPLPPFDRIAALPDPVLDALRTALETGGYDADTLDRVSRHADAAIDVVRPGLIQWHLDRHPVPAERLAMLMAYRGWLPRAEADSALGAALVAALVDAGLLAVDEDGVRCPFRLLPFMDVWVLADDRLQEHESVMPPGPTTERMCRSLPPSSEASFLDVGCGPGTMALVAARRGAKRAFGTDVNPRAIAMARVNARLNRLGAEFRTGDLIAPVADLRFDRVVAQPPFILQAPGTAHVVFLHGGPRGDAISQRLLRTVGGVLSRRGEALILSDVPLVKGATIAGYLRDDLGPCGVDLLVLHATAPRPRTHALIYASFESRDAGPDYVAAACRHLGQIEDLGIEEFRHTLFVARRPPDGAGTIRSTAVEVRDGVPITAETRARLWAAVAAAHGDDAALEARTVRVAPGAQWLSRRPEPEGEVVEHRVRFDETWPATEQVQTDAGVALCSLLQQHPDVALALAAYAELADSTADAVRTPVFRFIRDGLMTGLLVVTED